MMDIQYVHGVDVSSWNGKIDWGKLSSVAKFAFIRAGFFLTEDKNFAKNWSRARDAGVLRGAYWFFSWQDANKSDARMQADAFLDAVGGETGELGLACDFETVPYRVDMPDRRKALAGITAFIQRVESETGRNMIFYSNPSMIAYLRPSAWLIERPLWIANYKVGKPYFTYWKNWTFWQFTNELDGSLYGVGSKYVDGDYFNGTLEELAEYCKTGTTSNKKEPAKPLALEVVRSVNIRTSPSVESGAVVGLLQQGDVVKVKKLHIENQSRVWVKHSLGWSAAVYDGIQFMK